MMELMATKDQKYNTKIRMLNRENKKWKKKNEQLQEKYNKKWLEAFNNEMLLNELTEENKKLKDELDAWKNYYNTAHQSAHSLNVENKQLKKDLQNIRMKLQDYEEKMKHFV